MMIVTKGGFLGSGQCDAPAAPRGHASLVRGMCPPFLAGRDARLASRAPRSSSDGLAMGCSRVRCILPWRSLSFPGGWGSRLNAMIAS